MMTTFKTIFDLIGSRSADEAITPPSPAERRLVTVSALVLALGLTSIWGLVANPTGVETSLRNALTVPMLLLVSAVVCIPAIVVVTRFFVGARGQTDSLLLSYSLGLFGGSLTLAALSPIVALYYHSSYLGGPFAAKASLGFGFVAGWLLMVRADARLAQRGPKTPTSATRFIPHAVLVVGQLAVMAQLASSVDPIFDQRTPFGHGIDALTKQPNLSAPVAGSR